ncbi:PREDICTED: uncharacterized protein LOC109192388 [Ipomoea nil]|uniref:uncharacterized protein LOC109192388 n=1 Tax=Ipomoea nil TaxID=35883 RepID=UPI000901C50E|nr:PREDICTED: uncharacterized protein LOC109192388 [Ipomoea nil]
MEVNIEEALKAKADAEKRFSDKDFVGAKSSALKAEKLCPGLEGIAQMVLTFGVYSAAEMKINGEVDLYAVLGLDPSADKAKVKKQYKKMAVLLHPDKNKSIGADGAFKLVSEAWTVLSDVAKKSSYDHRRNISSMHTASAASNSRLDTFWTVCTSCHVQYEYLRKYVNKRLSCKNCRGVFIAVETGLAPVNGSYQYCSWSYVPENGYGSRGCGVTHASTASIYCANNGVSGHHTKHGSEYASNFTFQWSTLPGNSAGVIDPSGISSSSSVSVTQSANRKGARQRANGKQQMEKVVNGFTIYNEQPVSKPGRPAKRRKVEPGNTYGNNNCEVPPKTEVEVKISNENGNPKHNSKLSPANENSTRRCLSVPIIDTRKLLIDKARTVICKKLEEMKLASEAAAAAAEMEKKKKALAGIEECSGKPKKAGLGNAGHQSEPRKTESMAITVPDSDFHDFDKDRAEECFKPKQIWALYDEEDGMPRLYCLIRQVISVKPFKIHISYLSSKSDSEFGSVNWLCSGFTKSCGHFRAFNSETVEQVNIFSHLLSKEKAGRGGCVRIFPKTGDIWAVYRNWSSDWNRATPDEVRHQYEMVEILDGYSEEFGVHVAPLIKLGRFKTVYRRNSDQGASRWIPKREMLRFSHMVPSCLLKEGPNLPDGCWDLDPAATPEELLQGANHVEDESHAGNNNADEHSKNKIEHRAEEKIGQAESTVLPGKSHESVSGVQVQDIPNQAQNPPEPPPGFPVIPNQAQNPPEPPPGFPVVITDIQNRKEACQTQIFSS